MKRKEGFPGQISYVVPDRIQELIQKNPLISDLYLTDIGYYPSALYHYRERIKGIDQYILIYCVSGSGVVQIENENMGLSLDQFIIIPAGKSHFYYSSREEPWSIYWIHFSGEKANYFEKFSGKCCRIERGNQSRINSRLELFEELFQNMERGFGMDTLEYVNTTLGHLLLSFTHLDQYRIINKGLQKDPVAQSINFMLENLNSNMRLKELAKSVTLSESHYSRIFSDKTGHSPIDYFNQLKIQRACRLLDIPNLSVAEVAGELGINDPFYFSRLFKKIMGISPRNYRNRLKSY